VACIDPAQHIVVETTETLEKQALVNKGPVSQPFDFYCSARPDQFAEVTGRFLLMPAPQVKLKHF
jgi:glutamate racemase